MFHRGGGRGRGRGGFGGGGRGFGQGGGGGGGGGFRDVPDDYFEVFPRVEEFPNRKDATAEEMDLICRRRVLQSFYSSSSYLIESSAPKSDEMSKEIERYADRLKPKTKVARCRPLTSLLKLNSAYFPRELLQGLQHEKLNKEISESTLQPDSAKNVNLRKMDYLEKLEKVKDGKPEKEKKEDEDEDEGNEENEEEEEEIGEDDYHENFGFDDDEDYLDDVDDGGLDIGDCY